MDAVTTLVLKTGFRPGLLPERINGQRPLSPIFSDGVDCLTISTFCATWKQG